MSRRVKYLHRRTNTSWINVCSVQCLVHSLVQKPHIKAYKLFFPIQRWKDATSLTALLFSTYLSFVLLLISRQGARRVNKFRIAQFAVNTNWLVNNTRFGLWTEIWVAIFAITPLSLFWRNWITRRKAGEGWHCMLRIRLLWNFRVIQGFWNEKYEMKYLVFLLELSIMFIPKSWN